jgi:hypothetical protein
MLAAALAPADVPQRNARGERPDQGRARFARNFWNYLRVASTIISIVSSISGSSSSQRISSRCLGVAFRSISASSFRHRSLMARVCSRSSRVVLGRCTVSLVISPYTMAFAVPECRMNVLGGKVNRLVRKSTLALLVARVAPPKLKFHRYARGARRDQERARSQYTYPRLSPQRCAAHRRTRRRARAQRNGRGDEHAGLKRRHPFERERREPDLTAGTVTRWRPLDRLKRVRQNPSSRTRNHFSSRA